jgi:alpha-tubulin suppressor-like RCC1 family protein
MRICNAENGRRRRDRRCVYRKDGKLFCWGANDVGQLGLPPGGDAVRPAEVLALGGAFSCALTGDGSLHCWGWNQHGQIGNGATSMAERRAAPVRW